MTTLNYKDFTVKAKLKDIESIESILTDIDAKYIGLDLQTDHYFEIQKGKLKWRHGTIENLITHYERVFKFGIERTIVYRYDLNPTGDQIKELKENHIEIDVIRKERKIYLIDNVKVHIDKLSSGRQFIEIEAIDRSGKFSDNELIAQCHDLKLKLGIANQDLVQTGYLTDKSK